MSPGSVQLEEEDPLPSLDSFKRLDICRAMEQITSYHQGALEQGRLTPIGV